MTERCRYGAVAEYRWITLLILEPSPHLPRGFRTLSVQGVVSETPGWLLDKSSGIQNAELATVGSDQVGSSWLQEGRGGGVGVVPHIPTRQDWQAATVRLPAPISAQLLGARPKGNLF